MTAIENHEPVDIEAAAKRCKDYLPQHPEDEERLKERVESVAMKYGAAVMLH